MDDFVWLRPNMDVSHIDKNAKCIITFFNSGDLCSDFYKYACDFYNAAEHIILYLLNDSAKEKSIARLDLWYFAMVYLFRQSLELLLKACAFQTVTSSTDRKVFIGEVRHDLKQSLEKLIKTRGLTIDGNENAEWLMKYLTDITHLDKNSDMFRYPFGNNLEELFAKQTHISLLATHDNMKKAHEIIDVFYQSGVFSNKSSKDIPPQLIIEGGNYYQQSVVGYKRSKYSFYPYCSSYFEVGNFLKDTILTQGQSSFFMPMCYLYRNAVELGVKRLIIEDSHIEISDALKVLRNKKHSVLGLWNSIENEVEKYSNAPKGDTTLKNARKYIQSLHDFDTNSDMFRYPCNKNLSTYFLTPTKFDVENVALCFEELCNFLDCVDISLSVIKDYECEMASYYDNDYI